jgi:hypothetical protein
MLLPETSRPLARSERRPNKEADNVRKAVVSDQLSNDHKAVAGRRRATQVSARIIQGNDLKTTPAGLAAHGLKVVAAAVAGPRAAAVVADHKVVAVVALAAAVAGPRAAAAVVAVLIKAAAVAGLRVVVVVLRVVVVVLRAAVAGLAVVALLPRNQLHVDQCGHVDPSS